MDLGVAIGLLALLVSCLSMAQGWLSDNATRKRLDAIGKVNDRQADQIDGLIELNKSNLGQTNQWLETLNRILPGGDG
jgi:hypothetical protein